MGPAWPRGTTLKTQMRMYYWRWIFLHGLKSPARRGQTAHPGPRPDV